MSSTVQADRPRAVVTPGQRTAAADDTKAMAVATPLVAAAYAGGIAYVWLEAIIRLLYTNNADINNAMFLWQGRAGDVGMMWLVMSVLALVVFFVLGYLVFKGRQHVWTIMGWTTALVLSALIAPLIAEIGQSIGL